MGLFLDFLHATRFNVVQAAGLNAVLQDGKSVLMSAMVMLTRRACLFMIPLCTCTTFFTSS